MLLHYQDSGLREVLNVTKKHKKRGKPLDLKQRKKYHGGAVFWSSRKIREACAREVVKQQGEHEEQLAKANRKELQAAAKLFREEAEERCVAREVVKVVRAREKADKEAVRAAWIAAQNTKRAPQTIQKGKRKASGPPPPNFKRQRRGGGSAAVAAFPEAAPAAAPQLNSRGHAIKLPCKHN
jgi:hypothetical protein